MLDVKKEAVLNSNKQCWIQKMDIIGLVLGIVSAIAAIISIVFARQAVKTAEKTYSMDLLSQIYEMYHTDTMYQALQIVWQVYHRLWQENSETPVDAKKKTNAGIPIPDEVAKKFIQEYIDKKEDSVEWKAIHKVWTFWKYIVLLISEGVLDQRFITSFTSTRILGFLYPYEEVYSNLRGGKVNPETSFKRFYETMKSNH